MISNKIIKDNCCININSEEQLQREVVKYLKKTDILFTATLGEYLESPKSRRNANKDGYYRGISDILILTPSEQYNGMAIEFKSPKGTGNLTPKQRMTLSKLKIECGYFVLLSNDFVEIITLLTKYINGILD
mgnify:CR=1 FL=1